MGLINNFGSIGARARQLTQAATGGILGQAGARPAPGRREGEMVANNALHEGGLSGAGSVPSSVSSPQAAPVGGPGPVVGRRPLDQSKPLNALSEIVGYQPETAVVLTSRPNIQLSPQQQRVAVPLEVTGRVIVIWSGLQEDRRTYSDLLTQLEREKYTISSRYTASVDLIRTVYEGAGLGVQALSRDASAMAGVIDKLLMSAHQKRASDIHVYRKMGGTEVFFRIDGEMVRELVESPDWGLLLARGLFVAGDTDTKQIDFNPKVPQAMTVSRRVRLQGIPDPIDLRLRFQSSPAYPSAPGFDSFDVVMRVIVIGRGGAALTMDALGFLAPQKRGALVQLEHAKGLTILIGATGSGKSTTLQSMVAHLAANFPGQKILAVEDPPEYPLAARQIPVNIQEGSAETETSRISTSFLRALRAAMRMDPDSILIGEIRDPASAQMAMNAALTGHRVLTTFHASSLVHCLQRLMINGVSLDVLGSEGFLRSIISQSLIPLLCPHCSQPLTGQTQVKPNLAAEFARVRERLSRYVDVTKVRVKGPGCKECDQNGTKGRSALVEMLVPDLRMQGLISEGKWLALGHYWAAARLLQPDTAQVAAGLTMLEHGVHLVGQGKVCPLMLDRHGIGRIGEETSLRDRVKELQRLGVIDQAEMNDALARYEREPHYPGLGGPFVRGHS